MRLQSVLALATVAAFFIAKASATSYLKTPHIRAQVNEQDTDGIGVEERMNNLEGGFEGLEKDIASSSGRVRASETVPSLDVLKSKYMYTKSAEYQSKYTKGRQASGIVDLPPADVLNNPKVSQWFHEMEDLNSEYGDSGVELVQIPRLLLATYTDVEVIEMIKHANKEDDLVASIAHDLEKEQRSLWMALGGIPDDVKSKYPDIV